MRDAAQVAPHAPPPPRPPAATARADFHLPPALDEHLDIGALETWLWDAACAIRGATDAPKFKDFILPLGFYKRLSDVFDDAFARQVAVYEDEAVAYEIVNADHADALQHNRAPMIRFYVPRAKSPAPTPTCRARST